VNYLAAYADTGNLRSAEKRSGIRLEDAASETKQKSFAKVL
jgi:hypothetical protein